VFHTDNGKEFTGSDVLELLKEYSNHIVTVTGRPRTPRDQGSVESMNKTVKSVLEHLQNAELLTNRKPNWTRLLGKAMQPINSKKLRGYDEEPYKVVFGQPFNPHYSCKYDILRKCKTIDDMLKCTDDEKIRQVAKTCILDDKKKES
jgi:hypothetical protein